MRFFCLEQKEKKTKEHITKKASESTWKNWLSQVHADWKNLESSGPSEIAVVRQKYWMYRTYILGGLQLFVVRGNKNWLNLREKTKKKKKKTREKKRKQVIKVHIESMSKIKGVNATTQKRCTIIVPARRIAKQKAWTDNAR
jgi:hypothetical protein